MLNRFQYSEYRIDGRFADAATAKASATRNAMFMLLAKMPPKIASAPMTSTVLRATFISAAGSALPSFMTEL